MAQGGQSQWLDVPDYRRSGVAFKYVKRGYHVLVSHLLTIVMLPIAASFFLELANMYKNNDLHRLWLMASQTDLTFNLNTVIVCVTAVALAILSYILLQTRPVYMVDFSVYLPPDEWITPYSRFMAGSKACGRFNEEALVFQEKMLARSGLGQRTYVPAEMHSQPQTIDADKHVRPPKSSMGMARREFEQVVFGAVEDLLKKTGIKPKQIGILALNCSLFNPTPSLTAMVINRFKLRSNIISYNLAGMGCSASPIAIDLARQMLELHPSEYALVISTENVSQNWYFGNDRSMLLPNCLFRAGAAAILLSNKRRDIWRAKYQLQHTVRTHLGAKDDAYECIFQTEDDDGNQGVRLKKELMAVAGEALKINVTTLGPMVLPISEQILFFLNLVARKGLGMKLKSYIPDFKLAFEHVCIHTGGRAVIDEIEKQLKLTPAMVEPTRASLYRFGNVSSASVWYVLAYIESRRGLRRNDRIWQLAFGSGFKCNSAVWRAMRTFKSKHAAWEDFDLEEMRAHLASLPNHNAPKKTQ